MTHHRPGILFRLPRSSGGIYHAGSCGCIDFTSTLGTYYVYPVCWRGHWQAALYLVRHWLRQDAR